MQLGRQQSRCGYFGTQVTFWCIWEFCFLNSYSYSFFLLFSYAFLCLDCPGLFLLSFTVQHTQHKHPCPGQDSNPQPHQAICRSATGYALHRQVFGLLLGPQNVSVRAKPSELTSSLFETPAPESLQTRWALPPFQIEVTAILRNVVFCSKIHTRWITYIRKCPRSLTLLRVRSVVRSVIRSVFLLFVLSFCHSFCYSFCRSVIRSVIRSVVLVFVLSFCYSFCRSVTRSVATPSLMYILATDLDLIMVCCYV
jgi:hypothetical protein